MGKQLHEVEPREVSGRDAIARFSAQFRAAAYKSLAILEGKEIDCIFCDFHDDYVVRKKSSNGYVYDFYQVKTKNKSNYQWSLLDVFSIPKKGLVDLKRVSDSFAGKLLLHTIRFNESCNAVILQTNIEFNDDACEVHEALKSGNKSHKHAKPLFEKFGEIFPDGSIFGEDKIAECLKKLCLEPSSTIVEIHGDKFLALARDAVYEYSEVDLTYQEFVEIAEKLLGLVHKKSLTKISEVTEKSLTDAAGITISDLLEVLSISRAGYQALVNGGDSAALKNTSIIQRKFKGAGASEDMVGYLCGVKVLWDEWHRTNRHNILEFDMNRLTNQFHDAAKDWVNQGAQLEKLFEISENLKPIIKGIELSKDLRLGGVLSEVVRSQA